jgi:hypothetical protein
VGNSRVKGREVKSFNVIAGGEGPRLYLLQRFFVCKLHYIDCLTKELGIDNSLGNPTYTPTTHTKEEILDNHRSVLCSFGISTKDEELDSRVKGREVKSFNVIAGGEGPRLYLLQQIL